MDFTQDDTEQSGHAGFPESHGLPPQTHGFEFHGNSLEYFRIWFSNIFFTIITLGIYAPWAKVRTKKYFYRNTLLQGEPFDYTGNPLAILKGYVIIIAAAIPLLVIQNIYPDWGGIIVILVYIGIIPFLIYKSLVFNARNLLYRNIRCSFRGTPGESYWINAGIMFLFPFTLGLIFPYWDFRKRKYAFTNLSYGNACFEFNGKAGAFYKYYTLAGLVPVLMLFLIGFLTGIYAYISNQSDTQLISNIFPELSEENIKLFWIGVAAICYAVFILSVMAVKQYLFSVLMNYTLNNLSSGRSVSFRSDIRIMKYLWVQFVNFLAMMFSMGLLYPWAKIRKTKYVTESISIIAYADLNTFLSVATPDVSAIGDAGSDLFDIDIAL